MYCCRYKGGIGDLDGARKAPRNVRKLCIYVKAGLYFRLFTQLTRNALLGGGKTRKNHTVCTRFHGCCRGIEDSEDTTEAKGRFGNYVYIKPGLYFRLFAY
jgi:hypothetical protein